MKIINNGDDDDNNINIKISIAIINKQKLNKMYEWERDQAPKIVNSKNNQQQQQSVWNERENFVSCPFIE